MSQREINGQMFKSGRYYNLRLGTRKQIEDAMDGDVNELMLSHAEEVIRVRFSLSNYDNDKFHHPTGYFFEECFVFEERNIDHEQKLINQRLGEDIALPDFMVREEE